MKYWIDFQVPGGKTRREPVGYSIENARAADGKRKGQKKGNRIFDMLPESKYLRLIDSSQLHLKPFIIVWYSTGMRLGN